MADPDYDRKIDDKPKRLFAEKGALEVDYQRGHMDPPDGGADIPPELVFAFNDGKGWGEVAFGLKDMTRVGAGLGVALLREFDPAALAPLPLDGAVTEADLEQEIDEMGERPTQKHARLIIGQIIDFADGDPYVEGRLSTRLQKKLGTTAGQIKSEFEFVRTESAAVPASAEAEERPASEVYEDDRSPARDDRDDDHHEPGIGD